MGFLSWIKRIFNKNITMSEADDKCLVALARNNQKIKFGTLLEVRPNFVAALCYHNKIADVFEEGKYRLDTNNMPLLTRMQKLTRTNKRGDLPKFFKADIYYLNLRSFEDEKFYGAGPIVIKDKEYKNFQAKIDGTVSFGIKSPIDFLEAMFTQYGVIDNKLAKKEVLSWIGELSAICVQKNKPNPQMLFERDSACFEGLAEYVDKGLYDCGVHVHKIQIDDVKFPPKVYKNTPFKYSENVEDDTKTAHKTNPFEIEDSSTNSMAIPKNSDTNVLQGSQQSESLIDMNREANNNSEITSKNSEITSNMPQSNEKSTESENISGTNWADISDANVGLTMDEVVQKIRYKRCPTCNLPCSTESLICFNCGHVFKD